MNKQDIEFFRALSTKQLKLAAMFFIMEAKLPLDMGLGCVNRTAIDTVEMCLRELYKRKME
jgi:hypothetical protein